MSTVLLSDMIEIAGWLYDNLSIKYSHYGMFKKAYAQTFEFYPTERFKVSVSVSDHISVGIFKPTDTSGTFGGCYHHFDIQLEDPEMLDKIYRIFDSAANREIYYEPE